MLDSIYILLNELSAYGAYIRHSITHAQQLQQYKGSFRAEENAEQTATDTPLSRPFAAALSLVGGEHREIPSKVSTSHIMLPMVSRLRPLPKGQNSINLSKLPV